MKSDEQLHGKEGKVSDEKRKDAEKKETNSLKSSQRICVPIAKAPRL